MHAASRANLIMHVSRALEREVREDPAAIIRDIEVFAGHLRVPRLRFLVEGLSYGIFEESSGAFLVVGRVP